MKNVSETPLQWTQEMAFMAGTDEGLACGQFTLGSDGRDDREALFMQSLLSAPPVGGFVAVWRAM